MVKSQISYAPVDVECRQQPRIEFYLPVSIVGMNVQASIADFSLCGFYIQLDSTDYFSKNQSLRLILRLPGEKASTMIKVKVVRIEKQGIGCEFIDLDAKTKKLLETNFEIFRWTLPIR
jgi:hypothetical protein